MLTEDRFTYLPNHVYAYYHLHYNNHTYTAIRRALEDIPLRATDSAESAETRRTAIMNLVIDASLERCGAKYYLGAEAQLRAVLAPFDSYLTTLAERHLANFGPPLTPEPPPVLPALFDELRVTCAELHRSTHLARQYRADKPKLAAAWLYTAALLVGAAADLLTDTFSPGSTWRVGAQDKLAAAVEALRAGLALALEDEYRLSPKTREAIARALTQFPPL